LTVTVTVAAEWASVTAVIVVPDTTVQLVAGVVPKFTEVTPVTNPVPVRVTVVPPAVGPADGATADSVGTGKKVNVLTASSAVVPVPPPVLTEMMTVPGAWALVTAVRCVASTTWTLAAVVVPNLTEVAPGMKPRPVIATVVPPAAVPTVGVKPVIFGATSYANSPLHVAVPAGVVTVTATVATAWDLVTAVIVVALTTWKLAAVFVPK
jgi:hypothetical protein